MINRRNDPANSSSEYKRAVSLIPGGVNSPVRSFGSVGGTPFFVERGDGAWIYDIEANRYLDYVMSWGPLIVGHGHPRVIQAVVEAAGKGTSFGASTRNEIELAAIVRERMPWVEKLRLVSSGTEACMTAVRLARGATGRSHVVKFDGGYHGHSDGFLVKAGSGLATDNLPASAGVPAGITACTLSIPYNDRESVEKAFLEHGSDIAAVIVEPVAANMGVVPPADGFLQFLRDITSRHGSLLIFDEVITGFRIAPGGGAGLFGIKPDLVCLGKILGGGLPIGGVGGRADVMDHLAPIGAVYQAGTLSGNPLSTAAGIATLRELEDARIFDHLREYADSLTESIRQQCRSHQRPVRINKVESLFTVFFTDSPVTDFESAKRADHAYYGQFFHALLEQGVYLPPSGFEAWFVSSTHKRVELDHTTQAIEHFFEDKRG